MHVSRTRTEPVCDAVTAAPDVLGDLAASQPSSGRIAEGRTCCVCGGTFHPRRPEARACSGKCRMNASRGRRVADLVARIEIAEAQLQASERGLSAAREALAGLRELATLGASKVMP